MQETTEDVLALRRCRRLHPKRSRLGWGCHECEGDVALIASALTAARDEVWADAKARIERVCVGAEQISGDPRFASVSVIFLRNTLASWPEAAASGRVDEPCTCGTDVTCMASAHDGADR